MPRFRLFNLATLATEEFDLDDHPAYLAASHAWIDKTFVEQPDGFDNCFGGRGIRAVIAQECPEIRHCWVDRLCINQRDKADKLAQIPLMNRIFGQAQAVVVFINAQLGVGQAEVDELVHQLQGALAMCTEGTWQEEGQFWQHGEGRPLLARAMQGLRRLASTVWATRVWTLQEYVLAKAVFWIGLDLKPFAFDDYVLSAIPESCDTLAIDECLGPEMQAVFSSLQGMANARLGDIDRTRVMELLGPRETKKPVDEIYGAMAASGVIINPIAGESKFSAWRRWCEAAITQGHVRWILLPPNGRPPHEDELWNCIIPYFSYRHKLSLSSGLDHVDPLREGMAISDGGVAVAARRIGTVKVMRRLGKVHEPVHGRIYRDITLILFAQAKWTRALQIAAAFGAGRYSPEQMEEIARVLLRSHTTALAHIVNRSENDFRPCATDGLQRFVWNDFMTLQEIQMIALNEGTGYLCQIDNGFSCGPLLTVLVSGEEIVAPTLDALDFEAKTGSGSSVLMAVSYREGSSSSNSNSSAHKVGMTLPVSEAVAAAWSQLPLETVYIGGRQCHQCNQSQAESSSGVSAPSRSSQATEARKWSPSQLSAMRVLQRKLSAAIRTAEPTNLLSQSLRREESKWPKRGRRSRTTYLKKATRRTT